MVAGQRGHVPVPGERGGVEGGVALAAFVERVRGPQALREVRPLRELAELLARGRRVDVQLRDRLRALAVGGGHAVRGGVAAADHDDVLARRGDLRRGQPGDVAVALHQVGHRGVDARQVVAGQVDPALDPRAGREHDGVVAGAQLVDRQRAADLDAVDELDPGFLQERHPPVDDPLLELEVRHAEPDQPARALVALVDDDAVAHRVELFRGGQARRPGADHADAPRRAPDRGLRLHPALTEPALDDPPLDALDRHGVVVDRQHAGRLARRRADQPRELGEVVRLVQPVQREPPLAAADEVVPLRDQVAERAAADGRTGRRSPCSAAPARAARPARA